MPQTIVHVRCKAAGAIRREKLNGRDVIIVPSFTLKSGIIMNGIKYEHDEIEKSYKGLERTPAPLGHPTVNGKFVSARDPEGINIGYVGAFNTNVRREGDRIAIDKVIDVQFANQSDGGKAVLAAIEKQQPIHTSTGLLCNLEAVENAADHKFLAKNIVWDHDCILLNEQGAATPEDGTGIFVNAAGESTEIQVINSSLTDAADQEIDWAGTRLVEALRRRENIGIWDKVKSAIMDAIGSGREPSLNAKEIEMADEKQLDTLSAEVKTLSETVANLVKGLPEAIANAVKPITDAHETMVANQKAKDDAEHADLVAKVVKANVLDEETAKATPLNTLRALAPKATPGKAAPLNSAFTGGTGDKPTFKLPEGDK